MKPYVRSMQNVCAIFCFLLVLISLPQVSRAESLYSLSKKGQKAYDAGDYQEAQDYFIKAQLEAPDNPHVYYNLGNAQYKNEDFESALNHYKQALKSDDAALKQKIHFNMGNTYFKQNDFEKSISEYEEALKIDPNDEDAKKNIDFVKKVMEQIEKQKNENKDDQKNDKKDQDKDQDKSGQDQKNQDQKDQKQDQDQDQKGQNKKDGSQSQDDKDKGEQPQPSGDEKKEEQKPESSQASQNKEEQPGDEEKKQAEKMLNRLKDQPGQALIPAYQQREVDKDW